MQEIYFVSDVARLFDVRPRDITTLFDVGKLDVSQCEIRGGRRLIPTGYLERIGWILYKNGKISSDQLDTVQRKDSGSNE